MRNSIRKKNLLQFVLVTNIRKKTQEPTVVVLIDTYRQKKTYWRVPLLEYTALTTAAVVARAPLTSQGVCDLPNYVGLEST